MEITEKIADVFNIMHDGSIEQWCINKETLTLQVSCPYLASLMHPTFKFFYIDLIGVSTLALAPWWDNILVKKNLLKPEDIFAGELEVLSAKVVEDKVHVTCNQKLKMLPYIGGVLVIDCAGIIIYDQAKKEMSLNKLDQICKAYWKAQVKI